MKIRIGRIPYLNSEIFYGGLKASELELISLVPSALSEAAREGFIDSGPLPTVTFFELNENFEPLGNFCIATTDRARSIFLYSRRPIEKLDGATIGVTSETTTTVQLMKAIFAEKFSVEPADYVSLDKPCDAFLLIGDIALRFRKGIEGYSYQYDLGEVWNQWTDLPFVFAQWAIRKDMDSTIKNEIEALLKISMEDSLANLDMIAKDRKDLDMTAEEIAEYIVSFNYRIGKREIKGKQRFKELLYGNSITNILGASHA